MKISLLLFILALFFQTLVHAQKKSDKEHIDEWRTELTHATTDSVKLRLLISIMSAHVSYEPGQGLNYEKDALALAKKINSQLDIARVKEKVGRLNWRIGNYVEARKDHFEALELYDIVGDKKAKAYLLVEIAQDYLDNDHYAEAKAWLLRALKMSKETGNDRALGSAYDILAYLYTVLGNTEEATKTTYEDLKFNEKRGDRRGIAHASANLGINFQKVGNYKEAFRYFKQGMQVAHEQHEKMEEANFQMAIGELFNDQRNFSEALTYYDYALQIGNEIRDIHLLALVYYGMGRILSAKGDYNEALKNYEKAATEYKSVANKRDLANVYSDMGAVYIRIGKYELAKRSFASAKLVYNEVNRKMSMSNYYSGMQLLDSATGNWRDAYFNHKEYINIRDSLFNKETVKKLVSSQMQYESDKKETAAKAEQEKKDAVTSEELKRQRNLRNSAFALLAIVLIFSAVVFRQRNKIAREKKRSDRLLADKELLIKEVHHRVKNNLEVVSSLLALQSAQIDDPNTREAMQEGQNRVHSIGIVHQKLYMGENLGAIEMKDYFINLSESILDSFGEEKRVQVECVMDKLNIDIDTAVPLGLIVNELLTNTLKYAFPDGREGKVEIKLEKRKDGILQLLVSDNGIGKSGLIRGTGFGGQLIALLTKQLSGDMREEINNGTRIFFEFKTQTAI